MHAASKNMLCGMCSRAKRVTPGTRMGNVPNVGTRGACVAGRGKRFVMPGRSLPRVRSVGLH